MSPCSQSCITAIAVKVLVMEAIRKTVSSVTGVFDAMSASPCPWKKSRDPSRITPTARPTAGHRFRIPLTLERIASSSIVCTTPPRPPA
jgi:hypothetical protein